MADTGKNHGNDSERDHYFKDRAGTENARFHVVPHDEQEWAVKKEGEEDPVYTAKTKSEAVTEARQRAEEAETMAIIHDDDGKIEEQHNYQK